jgi:hypothetical protein
VESSFLIVLAAIVAEKARKNSDKYCVNADVLVIFFN